MKAYIVMATVFGILALFLVIIPILLSSPDLLSILLGLVLFIGLIGTLFFNLWEKTNE